MLQFLFSIISIILLVFVSFILIRGDNIFDLITYSNFNNIYKKIENDIEDNINKNNNHVEYNIAPNEQFIYRTPNNITFNPLLKQIIIVTQDKEKFAFNVINDKAKLIPVFASLNPVFDYTSFNI